jgi:CheY-like chemotaxis protein
MARILIADNSSELTDSLSVLLQLNDFITEVAASRAKLMKQLETFRPDVVLLNIVFNQIDGRELCKEIKNDLRYKNIPIILISGSAELLKNFEECSAIDVMEKPFVIAAVVNKINKYCNTGIR